VPVLKIFLKKKINLIHFSSKKTHGLLEHVNREYRLTVDFIGRQHNMLEVGLSIEIVLMNTQLTIGIGSALF